MLEDNDSTVWQMEKVSGVSVIDKRGVRNNSNNKLIKTP